MPTKPPSLRRPAPRRAAWNSSKRASRQARGYGRDHERMRALVLVDEPLCRACLAAGRVTATTIADHIIPKAEGGTDERTNYQGLCNPCSDLKTAQEAARAQGRRPPVPKPRIGADGWPVDD